MDNKLKNTTKVRSVKDISNTLLLNASFIDNLGLMHGKMGISICFYYLARQTGNRIYEDYAGELIDEIYDEITMHTSVDFENGLAGIGWGIEYLVQNKFIEADTDEVLEEFDNRIFKELIYNTPKKIGLLNGIIGIGAYFLKRIQNPSSSDEKITTLTNKQTLIHVIDELERQTQDISEIIKEPEANTKRLELLNNQILEPSNNQTPEHSNPKPCFSITWNYPFLLWFLAELYQQNIFNFKVDKIIQRLLEPLSDKTNLPKLQSNRMLLALALTKLSRTIGTKETIETIKTNLLKEINREAINSELPPNNTTIKHGTSGIAWIFKQLLELTSDNIFKIEMEYWLAQCTVVEYESETKDIQGFESTANHKETAFGILEGKAGYLTQLPNYQSFKFKTIKH